VAALGRAAEALQLGDRHGVLELAQRERMRAAGTHDKLKLSQA
jgi:hypothetical protein